MDRENPFEGVYGSLILTRGRLFKMSVKFLSAYRFLFHFATLKKRFSSNVRAGITTRTSKIHIEARLLHNNYSFQVFVIPIFVIPVSLLPTAYCITLHPSPFTLHLPALGSINPILNPKKTNPGKPYVYRGFR